MNRQEENILRNRYSERGNSTLFLSTRFLQTLVEKFTGGNIIPKLWMLGITHPDSADKLIQSVGA